jgi:hypothetical protein
MCTDAPRVRDILPCGNGGADGDDKLDEPQKRGSGEQQKNQPRQTDNVSNLLEEEVVQGK